MSPAFLLYPPILLGLTLYGRRRWVLTLEPVVDAASPIWRAVQCPHGRRGEGYAQTFAARSAMSGAQGEHLKFHFVGRFRGGGAIKHCYVPTGRDGQRSRVGISEKSQVASKHRAFWPRGGLRPFVSRSRLFARRTGDSVAPVELKRGVALRAVFYQDIERSEIRENRRRHDPLLPTALKNAEGILTPKIRGTRARTRSRHRIGGSSPS